MFSGLKLYSESTHWKESELIYLFNRISCLSVVTTFDVLYIKHVVNKEESGERPAVKIILELNA